MDDTETHIYRSGACRERRSSSAVRELVRRLVSGDDDDDKNDDDGRYRKRTSVDVDEDEDMDEDGWESVDKPMLPPRPSDMDSDILVWERAMLRTT